MPGEQNTRTPAATARPAPFLMLKRLVSSLAGARRAKPGAHPDGNASEQVALAAAAHRRGERALARKLYLQALQLEAHNADALHLLGVLEYEERNVDEAVELIEDAIVLQPEAALYWMNCGLAYMARGETELAIAKLREAMRLRPVFPMAHANLLFALNYSVDAAPAAIAEEHKTWYRTNIVPGLRRLPAPDNTAEPERRLRVGYVSADLGEHVIALFVEPIFSNRDPRQVEVFAYDNGRSSDAVNARLRAGADQWRSVANLDDDQLAALIREDGIDILVDLAGHTQGSRLAVFARKPAPLQITYLGYPATTGVEAMDYRLTDAGFDPPGMTETQYVEKLVRLPDCLLCYQPPSDAPEVSALPALARGFVTFGSFNQPAKLGAGVLELWARLLGQVADSHLLMAPVAPGYSRERYQQIFAAHGVVPERIEFEPRLPSPQYQALRSRVDIALDPFPMNGGSTTCETLWMGVPLVTLSGDRFVSRAGTSLLTAAGLAECIARDEAEYVAIAAGLAADLPRLAQMRAALRDQMRQSPLLDGARFTRNLEAAYRQLWRDWCLAQKPAAAC
jgi:predicted O-linked N-acetylglucosamine transferase (SPINDLY family)